MRNPKAVLIWKACEDFVVMYEIHVTLMTQHSLKSTHHKKDTMEKASNTRTVYMSDHAVYVLDQRKLPAAVDVLKLDDVDKVCLAIQNMTVRGAPAIGATAAYG